MAIIRSSVESADAIPEFWLSEAIGYLSNNIVLASTISRDAEDVVAERGDTINITKRGSLTVQEPAENADLVPEAPSNTKVSVVLNQYSAVSWKASDMSSAMAVRDALNYMEDAANKLGEKIEGKIAALRSSFAHTAGEYGTAMSLATIRQARLKMNQNNAPRGNRYLAVSATAEDQLIALDKLTDVDRSGASAGLREAMLGRIYGFDVLSSNLMDESLQVAIIRVVGATNNTFTVTLGNGTTTEAASFVAAGSTKALIAAGLATDIEANTVVGIAATATAIAVNTVDATDLTGDYFVVIRATVSAEFTAVSVTNAATELEIEKDVHIETYNMAYHPNAMTLAMRPLPLPPEGSGAIGAYVVDEASGLAMRFTRQYDIKSRGLICSLDALYGVKVIDDRLATLVRS